MSNYILCGSNSEIENIAEDLNSQEKHKFSKKPSHEVIKLLFESQYLFFHCYYKNNQAYEYISTFGPLLKQ